ncbi:MAG: GGDEF domain-containing protein [Actinomycetes bacterium]
MSAMTEPVRPGSLEDWDALVFRRLGGGRWAHLGGRGRGEGWAGIVEVDAAAEPLLTDALAHGLRRVPGATSRHVVGPYWAACAALVAVSDDVVVVWGKATPCSDVDVLDDAELQARSAALAEEVTAVSPAKRLADELEVLHAVQRLSGSVHSDLLAALHHVGRVAAEALSCDMAAVMTGAGALAVVDAGWATDDHPGVAALLRELASREDAACSQDTGLEPLPVAFAGSEDIVSWLAVRIPEPVGGAIFTAHVMPRGFTQLCQRLAAQLADAAGVVLQLARLRDDLERALRRSSNEARRDPLTGLANRLAWEEALDQVRDDLVRGRTVTLASVDLDGLKVINDTHGHQAGDDVLVTLAHALQGVVRSETDVVARLGGDEFGLLLRGGDADPDSLLSRISVALDGLHSTKGLPVLASIGAAGASAERAVSEAFRSADEAMYAQKRLRKS